jgi:hypothetical protein
MALRGLCHPQKFREHLDRVCRWGPRPDSPAWTSDMTIRQGPEIMKSYHNICWIVRVSAPTRSAGLLIRSQWQRPGVTS